MAVTAVTPTRLVDDTVSADLNISDGVTASSTATDGTGGWEIALGSRGTTEQLLVVLLDDGSGCTVTVRAGDRGAASLAALGNKTITMAASDSFWYRPMPGRYEQDDNKINIISNDAGTKLIAFLMPVGTDGGSAIA